MHAQASLLPGSHVYDDQVRAYDNWANVAQHDMEKRGRSTALDRPNAAASGHLPALSRELPAPRAPARNFGPGAAHMDDPAFKLPSQARTTSSWNEITRRLDDYHGIDPRLAGNRLHEIKDAAGLGGADNVVFGECQVLCV